ncbi:hypothetical protein ACJMK2_009144 [Sinanodonta woodiana]|uniref:CUB domain-containing protein n=1 Tax=Sinanodonta woodiana TaxID=1069815 RepID=A0ABD3VEF7_SINWO
MVTKYQNVFCTITILTVIPIVDIHASETILPDADGLDKRHGHPEDRSTPETRPDSPCCSVLQLGCEINTIPEVQITGHCGETFVLDRAASLVPSKVWVLPVGLNCTYTVQSAANNERVAAIMYSLGTETGTYGNCTRNRLDIYDGTIVNSSRRLSAASGICGKTFPQENYLSSNDSLTVQFSTSPVGIQGGTFRIVVGTIETGAVDECYGEFQCKNGRCIDKNKVCNGHDNCGDSSDEDGCIAHPGSDVRLWMILFIIACVVCFILLCILLGIIIYRLCARSGYHNI